MESAFFVLNNTAPVIDLGGGVSRQILGYNDDMMMVKVVFEKALQVPFMRMCIPRLPIVPVAFSNLK